MSRLLIALINPNANTKTTAMMVGIAKETVAELGLSQRMSIAGHTAATGPDMIIDMDAISRSVVPVREIVHSLAEPSTERADALIVAAYGDPALGIAEAYFPARAFGIGTESMRTAAEGGRRFAVATTTPDLVPAIDARVRQLGLASVYGGVFLTRTAPLELAANPDQQLNELADAVATAISVGGAEAVIIGGGPLAKSARELAPRFEVPLIEPIPAAVRAAFAALI